MLSWFFDSICILLSVCMMTAPVMKIVGLGFFVVNRLEPAVIFGSIDEQCFIETGVDNF